MDGFKFIKNKNFGELPKTSGVYCFYDKNQILYIGKAINIQSRVKNHFFQPAYRDSLYLEKVNKIGYLETNSEIDALILEANLIKKYQPRFNVVWRDDKNYFYVAIEKNSQGIPFIYITHQPHSSSLRGASRRRGNLELVHKTPGLPRPLLWLRNDDVRYMGPFVEGTSLKKVLRFLRRVFSYYSVKKHPKTKCTYCHLGLCPGPNPDLKDYKKNLNKLALILQGKRSTVLNFLKKEMRQFSKENKFEEACKIRDKIFALEQIMSHSHIIETQNQNHKIQNWSETKKILQGLLWPSLRGVEATKQSLNRIECYDVSNIQGKHATGSMVVFTDGKPDKNLYRKFKIRMENTPNDIAMLKETLQRRFAHPEWKYPEIILIDGGKGQLNAAISVIARSEATRQSRVREQNPGLPRSPPGSLAMTVMSIAKGRQELYIECKKYPIPLKNLPREIYNLVLQLDDEAHRFAITYHKKLRKKSLLN